MRLKAYGKAIIQCRAFSLDLGVERSSEPSTQGLDGSESCTASHSLIESIRQSPRGHDEYEKERDGKGQALLAHRSSKVGGVTSCSHQ